MIKKDIKTTEFENLREYDLVHIRGQTANNSKIIDTEFDYIADNSYRVVRKVEMF